MKIRIRNADMCVKRVPREDNRESGTVTLSEEMLATKILDLMNCMNPQTQEPHLEQEK